MDDNEIKAHQKRSEVVKQELSNKKNFMQQDSVHVGKYQRSDLSKSPILVREKENRSPVATFG